jgi:adenine-specific DNA-methyltransferase
MARGKKHGKSPESIAADYRYTGEKRKNIPPAKIASEGSVPKIAKGRYYYNPHLAPVLRSDPTAQVDRIAELVEESGRRMLNDQERKLVGEALHHYQPWLEWSRKREEDDKKHFEVDPVALHIHQRVSAKAIIRSALREDVQKDLFADPQQTYKEAVQFYQHDMDWTNRLILGDSLQVMSSLALREGLAGKVQMIYVDPPYGVKFSSNFQPKVRELDVKQRESDLTREPEMVKAYRDTWTLGLHTYLGYLRERLIVARDLLSEGGSIFVQIGEENLHSVRQVLDEVFGGTNEVALIYFRKKTMPLGGAFLERMGDYLLWYARDVDAARSKFRRLYIKQDVSTDFHWKNIEYPTGRRIRGSNGDSDEQGVPFRLVSMWPPSYSEAAVFPVEFRGNRCLPAEGQCWPTNLTGMKRLARAERLEVEGRHLRFVLKSSDSNLVKLTPIWNDTIGARNQRYAVQTTEEVVQRCMLMTTDPGDLVLDPTSGGGTTASVAERWGRRWIAIDTSRVAIAISRQRLLTGIYDYFQIKGGGTNPAMGFVYQGIPRISLKSIANNTNLDPILAAHESVLDTNLANCSKALRGISGETRRKLGAKLADKQRREGKRAISDADRHRWELPEKKFDHWTIPFDSDPDWPKELRDAVSAYRRAWSVKMDEVNACVAANADQEELVDQPETVKGVLRVGGPFTVEGVHPEEMGLGDDRLLDGMPGQFSQDYPSTAETQNILAYLTRMVQHLKTDGLTFMNNKERRFTRLEPLFEQETGSLVHAEGAWDGADNGSNPVAVSFGPQYGPISAGQVEEAIRGSKRYDELVIAGFSFEAEASAVIQENQHVKLKIHEAYIRPDINPGMDGLLKDTPNSQLFTVFGQPEIEVKEHRNGDWGCTLKGVDIYDPVTNVIHSTGAEKVAAWFLDQDYDGRCFCITQAFFPDQDAWEKIARSLGSSADPEVFEAFKGTKSLPFQRGKFGRIAVKVIDPRGNEVMAIRALEA